MVNTSRRTSPPFLLVLLLIIPYTLGTVRYAKSSREFTKALKSSKQGDVIKLYRGSSYAGDFILPDKGVTTAITIEGNEGTKGGSPAEIVAKGTGLSIQGGKWKIRNLSVKGGVLGIYVYGTDHILDNVSAKASQTGVKSIGNRNKFDKVTATGNYIGVEVHGDGNFLQSVTATGGTGPGVFVSGDQNGLRAVTARGRGNGVSIKGDGNKMQDIRSNPPQKVQGNGNRVITQG